MADLTSYDFLALDVETAGPSRASLCAVGLAVVSGGEVVGTDLWLVRPPESAGGFSPVNVGLHGIDAAAVADAPPWEELVGQLDRLAAELPIVSVDAAHDRGVYEAATRAVGLSPHAHVWHDASALVRSQLPELARPSLAGAARALGVPHERRGDARDDAEALARVVLALASRSGAPALEELVATGAEPASAEASRSPASPAAMPAGPGLEAPIVPASLRRHRMRDLDAPTHSSAPGLHREGPRRDGPHGSTAEPTPFGAPVPYAAAPVAGPATPGAGGAEPRSRGVGSRVLGVTLVGVGLVMGVAFVFFVMVGAAAMEQEPAVLYVSLAIALACAVVAFASARAGLRRLHD